MSPIFGKRCPNCDFENNPDARFCAKCGSPLAGSGGKICGVCKTENRQDAIYCKKCGRLLSTNEDVQVQHNHWSRREGDFAAKLDISDLPGLLRKTLEVEAGTQALVYAQGIPQEILPPGAYTLDSIGMKISNWLKGVPKAATVLLVDVVPAEMVIHIEKRFTSDPLPVSLTMRLVVEVENAGKFMLAALHGRERYSMNDLRQYVEPEVASITDLYLRQHTLEQLVQNPATRKELELAVEEGLRTTFNQYGLILRSLRTVELDLQAQDKINGIKGNYSLLAEEGEAEYDGTEKLLALKKKFDLQTLAQETTVVELKEREVELDERKIRLVQRIRQTALSDRMDEVKSVNDFDKFLEEIDRQNLLSDKEKEDLKKSWREGGEDHDRARAFLLARTDVEEMYHKDAIEIKLRGENDLNQQEYQLELARIKAEKMLPIQEMERTSRMKDFNLGIDIRSRDFDQTQKEKWADANTSVDMFLRIKKEKAAIQQQIEEQALVMRLEEAKANVEREIALMDTQHKHEMERIEKLGTLGSEALIAASSVEQGMILKDLKRTEILKGMTEDQILAMAAENSPEIARVFEEKYRAVAEGKASEREKEIYERLLMNSKENQQILIDVQKDFMLHQQQMSQHDIDAIKDVSIAYAQKGSEPIIINSGGAFIPTSGHPGKAGESEETKTCPTCGRQVTVSSRYCQYCNNEFKDVK